MVYYAISQTQGSPKKLEVFRTPSNHRADSGARGDPYGVSLLLALYLPVQRKNCDTRCLFHVFFVVFNVVELLLMTIEVYSTLFYHHIVKMFPAKQARGHESC